GLYPADFTRYRNVKPDYFSGNGVESVLSYCIISGMFPKSEIYKQPASGVSDPALPFCSGSVLDIPFIWHFHAPSS
uniref:hypothetical protein n=1 Tax=Candidatus Fimivicinus sp. TaxID=3056640 RepID=UPI003FED6E6C